MKIKQVTPWNVSYPEPNDSDNTRYLTFCSIEADDGTVGWGEAITQFPESTRATAPSHRGDGRDARRRRPDGERGPVAQAPPAVLVVRL